MVQMFNLVGKENTGKDEGVKEVPQKTKRAFKLGLTTKNSFRVYSIQVNSLASNPTQWSTEESHSEGRFRKPLEFLRLENGGTPKSKGGEGHLELPR